MKTLYSSIEPPPGFDLRQSYGAFLCVNNSQFLLDAGIGPHLGWNASANFGTVHNLEAWTGNKTSENWRMLFRAFDRLRSRQIDRFNNIELLAREFKPATFHHDYIENSMLDQFQDEVARIEQLSRNHVATLARRFGIFEVIESEGPGQSLDIHLRFKDEKQFNAFCEKRFRYGLQFNRFVKKSKFTVTLSLKLSYRNQDIELLNRQIERLLLDVSGQQDSFPSVEIELAGDAEQNYRFADLIIQSRMVNQDGVPTNQTIIEYVRSAIPDGPFEIDILDAQNYPQFRAAILQMQEAVYEPARQSPPEEFHAIFDSEKPVAIVIHQTGQIVAMGLAGPICNFHGVRGFENDPYRDSSDVLYMVDVTVAPHFRGGMGRIIKNSVALLGLQKGYTAIHGRNRAHLARGMWAINLSLGSFELQHLVNDYPDQGPHRDCFYYRCPISWPTKPEIKLDAIRDQMPLIVNGGPPDLDST